MTEIRPSKIKCLTLWQPWASAIAIGAKKIETRHWKTAYRGPIAIHAAKRWTREEIAFLSSTPLAFDALCEAGYDWFVTPKQGTTLPLGAIVAVANLVDCIPTYHRGALGEVWLRDALTPLERAFGDYSPGRFGWTFKNMRALEEPIPYKGEQGLFEVDAGILAF